MRKCGLLLPVTSLPSEYGIGCFSKAAYDFVDFLKESGQSCWQVLPLCPTGFGDSPYQSFSTFAGNPYMINLTQLIDEGLLTKAECDSADLIGKDGYISYEKQYKNRLPLLKTAFERSRHYDDEKYLSFADENEYWLDDYALFMALKDRCPEIPWRLWKSFSAVQSEVDFHKFVQFKFYCQWHSLKEYANKNGICIIGDIPIYVSYDSADVWANPNLFELDENLLPLRVAGCPPDGFSPTGQRWGNPLYRWETHRQTNYEWWIKRFRHAFSLYDSVRLDHFRGFESYYCIDYDSPDASHGKWEKGPGAALFCALKNAVGDKNIIAEDLGFITNDVKAFLQECGFPGMKILQFAFDSRDGASADYLPHNYPHNCVAYTGTHDNQTISSWFLTITEKERQMVRSYLCDNFTPDSLMHLPMIAEIMKSPAQLCIIPVQDYLGLSDSARINTPSTLGKNWCWRLGRDALDSTLKNTVYNMTKLYGRL